MTDELLNTPLYNHLCTSVQNWFEKGNGSGVSYFHIFKFGNGKSFHLDNVWLGGKKRNIEFCVNICTDGDVRARYIMNLSIKYNDKIGIEDWNSSIDKRLDLEKSVLHVINMLHNEQSTDATIVHSSIEDKIYISKELYFYPGAVLPEDEVNRILDDFFSKDYVEKIADIMEHNAWNDPLPYLIEQLKDERKQQ